jgi:hypothetical protein
MSFFRRQWSSVVAVIFAVLVSLSVHANEIAQTFSNSWRVDVWNYYGQVSAMQWQYTPYTPWDSSLGTLTGVTINTSVTGQRDNPTDSVYLRYAFFTGWSPDQYQFYNGTVIGPGNTDFSFDYSVSYTATTGLSTWLSYEYLPQANYYFESRTNNAGHSINAVTTLEYTYDPVPDGGLTVLMLGGGLAGLVLLRRRVVR